MANSVIAVRIANGSFVPVLMTESKTRRRLVLTTINDNQTNVQIDLYRGSTEEMDDAEYVGSLVIENIDPAPHGEPDIALLLGVDKAGNLNATATDKASGEYQSLSVGLASLGAGETYDIPDFKLSDEELTLDDLSLDEEQIILEDESLEDVSPGDTAAGEMGFTLGEEGIELDVEAPAEKKPAGSLEVPTHGIVMEEQDDGEYDAVTSRSGSDDDESLGALGDFSDESVSFDASFTEEGASLDDEELSFADAEGTADEPSLESELMARSPRSGDEDELEDFDLSDLGSDDIFSEAGSAAVEEGMVEAELGDEDFTFDETDESGEPLFAAAPAEGDDEGGGEPLDFGDDLASGFGSEFEEPFPEESSEGPSEEETLTDEEFEELDRRPAEAARDADEAYTDEEPVELAPRRSNAIIFVGYIVLALAALGVITYFIFRLLEGPAAPELRAMRLTHLAALLPMIPRRNARPNRRRR